MKKMSFFLLLLLISAGLRAQNLDKLDQYISKVQKDWKVPGLSVGIVKDGKLVFAKGYGVLEKGKSEPTNEHTLYAIASNTKAFTSAAIARLVDEGKLNWHDHVVDYLPWFKLHDPWITAHLTIEDLLCHRVGFRTFSGDLLWNSTTYSRRDIVERARYLEPSYDFRAGFGYSNIMFITAGEVIEAVTGQSWEQYITEQFLKPLGMNESVLSTTQLPGKKNVASPHAPENGEYKAIPWENWDNMGPAGAIITSVSDMSKWLTMQLAGGTVNDHTYFTKKQQDFMWEAHNPLTVSQGYKDAYPSTHYRAAGLGWFTFDYKGVKVVNHGGGYIGMLSQVAMVPEKNLGILIFTNGLEGVSGPIMYRILDTYLGGDMPDRSAQGLERKEKWEASKKADKEAFDKATIQGTQPSLALENYAGTYSGDLYGDATIEVKDGKLNLQMVPTPAFHAVLKHRHFDTFLVQFPDFPYLPEGTVNFVLNAAGEVEEMRIFIPNDDFWFEELKFVKQKKKE
ncbi:MAG: serine hydrolase [Flavobacteriales bacterium]|nr:serine hydrolase [Flavobacteriales bacterium]MCB9447679.1 serine hydrolase [Flavobacteriales bacterium]